MTTEKAFTLQNAVLIDPKENFEGIGSLTIEDGVITSVNGNSKGNEIIDGKGLFNVIQIIESFIKKTNLEKTNLEKTNLEKIIYSN